MAVKDFETDNEKGSPRGGEPAPKNEKGRTGKDAAQGSAQAGSQKSAEAGSPEASAAGAAAELSEELSAELDELDELAKALAEVGELRDRHLRLKAEWDNYRRRTEAERADERSRATQRLVEKLLPLVDDLERAVEHSSEASKDPLREGITQVLSKMQDILASEGVKIIDPKGQPFDANLHSAISKVEDNKVPDETVLEVYQKGYEMGSRVLRPACVVVSCRP
ncbi:MAG: nucleotide exchange factor GrpE [Coriobacteriales bacterium]|jgi:molecular chaperone GrpE|nr:nucleotide exchange factor GrpE [Coriobacteriales bacterium]